MPLFETGEDLRGAIGVLEEWTALPGTRDWLAGNDNRCEIMLGYSDSAKDIGPAAATLTLYDAQRQLVAWGQRRGVTLTLFHGRGGSLGRGGGPLHRAITAQPTGSVDGRFKVTEQGEVIFARYADVMVAQHHLERVTSAVLLADQPDLVTRRDAAALEFADLGERIERAEPAGLLPSVAGPTRPRRPARRGEVRSTSSVNYGSAPRSARRSGAAAGRNLEDLRAIPWVFSWSMTRVNLPGWYGLGSGLAAVGDVDMLAEAYRRWPVFAALLDVAEMSLAKVNRHLVSGFLGLGERPELTERILAELDLTQRMVLQTLGQRRLLERKPHLDTAVRLRGPHIDALSQIQLRALRMLHGKGIHVAEDERQAWRTVLLLTVNGLAAGLQNTG